MIFKMYVTQANKGTMCICPSDAQIHALLNGRMYSGEKIERVEVIVRETEEVLASWPGSLSKHLKCVRAPVFDCFRIYSYRPVLEAVVERNERLKHSKKYGKHMTQAQISEHYGLHHSRVSILKDFGFLEVSHKEGRTEFFSTNKVLKLAANERFQTYLANVYERSSNERA